MAPFDPNESNLRIAREKGIKPLSLREIIAQIEPEKIGNAVFFDTPPSNRWRGNFWRVTEMTEETATLQLCNTFGNYDSETVSPVEISLDRVLFTGVSIQKFELDGRPATVAEATQTVKEASRAKKPYPRARLKGISRTYLYSNSEGRLPVRAT